MDLQIRTRDQTRERDLNILSLVLDTPVEHEVPSCRETSIGRYVFVTSSLMSHSFAMGKKTNGHMAGVNGGELRRRHKPGGGYKGALRSPKRPESPKC
ncbi:hypothetical protein PABG_11625 [Paracoccidioides brasiliensis Pb03]|nr:hypothetical protein PABG_11625 [Paracoccidioides brasiliensis Pb03]